MQHYVIDSDFVGNRCTTINHQPFYTSTGFFKADSVFLSHLLPTITEQGK